MSDDLDVGPIRARYKPLSTVAGNEIHSLCDEVERLQQERGTQIRTVLGYDEGSWPPRFTCPDWTGEERGYTLTLDADAWRDMGEPGKITVTIEPRVPKG